MTIIAATLASRLHAGQLDKQGYPYIDHLTAVVTILEDRWPGLPSTAAEAAWLHDAMRDAGATKKSLAKEGIGPEAIRLIELLTRPGGMPYHAWIVSLAGSGSLWAIRIKLADNAHNSAPGCGFAGMVERRYGPARAVLEAAQERLWEATLH